MNSLSLEQTSRLLNGVGLGLLLLAFISAAVAAAWALAAIRRARPTVGPGTTTPPLLPPSLLNVARRFVYVAWGATLAASLVLLHLLINHDFSNEYVASYTDRKMALLYLITALWGGQKGSLLFWALLLISCGALVLHRERRRRWAGEAWAIVALMGVFLFFVSCLLFGANPFERFLMLGFVADGEGLNPLLQNLAMVYHPPAILAGYAIWAIPFSYAVAALIVGDTGVGWQKSLRGWTVGGWLLLSLGNLFGAFWAYDELGWGGFWGWDPVENASLMPWFTASAYVHSVMVQERRGVARVWNFNLLFITFMLTLLGTFITRTGIVQSVHAFGSGTILGEMFLVFMVLLVILWLALVIWRWRPLTARASSSGLVSQETLFALFNWTMVAIMLVVLSGTLAPTLYKLIAGGKITIEAAWFNRYVSPLGVLVISLVAICPLVPWKGSSAGQLARSCGLPLGVAILLTLGGHFLLRATSFWYPGSGDDSIRLSGLASLALFFVNLTVATLLIEVVRAALAQRRRTGAGRGTSLLTLLLRERRKYGGYLNHLGVALLMLCFAGVAYKIERDQVLLRRGQSASIGPYELRFDGLTQRSDAYRTITEALVTVSRDGRTVATVKPAQHVFAQLRRQVTTEVDTYDTLTEDLFVALSSYDERGQEALFNVIVNPLVIWLWIGAVFLTLGTLLALLPGRLVEALLPGGRGRAEVVAAGPPERPETEAASGEDLQPRPTGEE